MQSFLSMMSYIKYKGIRLHVVLNKTLGFLKNYQLNTLKYIKVNILVGNMVANRLMKNKCFKYVWFSVFLLSVHYIQAQEVPGITSYNRSEYRAAHQNWMIAQDCENYLFVANSEGVLVFNGKLWKLIPMPNNQIARSVFLGNDCKIYASGFEFFGYIDMSNRMQPKFEAIGVDILQSSDQEIWNIFGAQNSIYFQSFSELYKYDYDEVTKISTPTNIMLGRALKDQIYIPKIEQGLYEIKDEKLIEVDAIKKLPNKSKIASFCQGKDQGEIIIATQINGLFLYKNNFLTPLQSELNDKLIGEQINKILRMDNGDYVIGTILNGVYISSDLKTIKFHINKSNGLLNNTVLSLFEDHLKNLWVGLDKGICRIKTSDKTSFYYDNAGKLGTIFTFVEYKGATYFGTNQGVFKRTFSGTFDLVENSQGQIWSFLVVDGDLLCGHNAGTYQIKDDKAILISEVTGGWDMTPIGSKRVLQSSYTGFVTLIKKSGTWQLERRMTNGELLANKFALHGNKAICYHSYYGLRSIEFSPDFKSLISYKHLTINDSINLSTEFHFIKSDSNIVLSLNDKKYAYDGNDLTSLSKEDEMNIIKNSNYVAIESYYQNLKLLRDIGGDPSSLAFQPSDAGSNLIYGIDNGYAMIPKDYESQKRIHLPELDYVTVDNRIQELIDGRLTIPPDANEVKFYMKNLTFQDKDIIFMSRLDGYRNENKEIGQDGIIDFFNFDNGEYSLKVFDYNGEEESEIAKIRVEPYWYESWLGIVLYIFLITLSLYFINIYQKRKYNKQKIKLELDKNKELESERIKAKNDKLERELTYKSKMLANSAMTHVQKNKMLNNLKELIKNEKQKVKPGLLIQKVTRLIDKNMNSDKDWEIFERNFAEVHQDFLDKLRSLCNDITPGELKLAAYIRMNLSSKEIAPLMNISVRSVENKRYRLRKKLNISGESNLKEYLTRL
jgi:DNA-binding CsgD family transcriptional regulator